MGSFANSLFQFLLGWIRILLSSLWDTATSPSTGSLLRWVGDHWLALFIGVCVLGVLADLAVYMFRWRPYRVWASFLRRRRRRKEARERGEPGYIPGDEVLPEEAYEAMDASEVSYPAKGENRARPGNGVEYRSAWTWDGPSALQENGSEENGSGRRGYFAAPEISPEAGGEEEMTARFEQAIRPRRRRARVKEIFSEEGQQAEYTAPQELIDRREAYHRPVYPRNWKGNNSSES